MYHRKIIMTMLSGLMFFAFTSCGATAEAPNEQYRLVSFGFKNELKSHIEDLEVVTDIRGKLLELGIIGAGTMKAMPQDLKKGEVLTCEFSVDGKRHKVKGTTPAERVDMIFVIYKGKEGYLGKVIVSESTV